MISRRKLFVCAASPAVASSAQRPRFIAVSSSNGLACTAKAVETMKAGGDTLDAAIAGVNIQELDPRIRAWATAACPTRKAMSSSIPA